MKSKQITNDLPFSLSNEDPIRLLSDSEQRAFFKLWEITSLSESEPLKGDEENKTNLVYVETGSLQIRLTIGGNDLLVKTISEGQIYGIAELGLNVLNKNSYLAEENSKLLVLSQESFLHFFQSNPKRKEIWNRFVQEIRLRDELRIHPYFRKLSKHEIIELSGLLIKREISKGKILIREGSKSSSLFFIQSGKFRITKSSWSDDYSSFVEAGSVLGEMGVIEKKVRNATVTASEDSIFYELLAKDAETFFKKSESLYTTLRSVVAERKWNQTSSDLKESSEEDFQEEEDSLTFLPSPSFSPKRFWFRSFPFILEESSDETANACRKMILSFWGFRNVDLLLDSNFPNPDGEVTTASWKESFERAGGSCYVVNRRRFERDLKNRVWIVRWEGNQYVVVVSFSSYGVKIADPRFGIKEVSKKEWEAKAGRLAVVFIPKTKPKLNFFDSFPTFPGLAVYFRSTFSFLFSGILASFLIKSLEICLPLVNLYLIDSVLLQESREYFIPVLTAVTLLSLSQIYLSYLRTNVLFYSTSKVNQTIVIRFLEKLLSLPLSFFEKHKKGEILQRWEEIEGITRYFSEQSSIKVLDWIFGVIVFMLFFFLSPILLGTILFFLIPEMILVYKLHPIIARETKRESLRSSETLSYFIETINGNETVKNLGAVSVQRWDFEKKLTAQLNSESNRMFYHSILETSSESFRLLTNICVLLFGTYQIFSDQITLGTLFAVLGLISYVRSPMMTLAEDGYRYQKANLSWRRLKEWDGLESEYSPDMRISRIEIPDIQGLVEFKNVYYNYRSSKSGFGLNGADFVLNAGSKYAFVGRSGSGKSTILKLLLGFYEPSQGEILLDGVLLSEIWTPSYRSKMGVLFQENPVLTGTIRENISLGRPEGTLSEVVEAAKLALIHEDISKLPLGYDTELSEKGMILSGGQKQRLALARIFLQKPSLLVLDEPTSAMDRETEEKILNNLHRVFKDKTIIVVAHRLDTIRNYDKIFVVEAGKIEESGAHTELLQGNGIYHLLHSRQEAIR
ncbi:peptidase domain-containing ABC transporter [Leptospira ilyithenensis]|uniref:ATP-binding cassette domain-containing protein n=1 Tax=Leptospira ilyithenensis TaxID=2484901 RepID=A0A4R9LRG9_9LEPT|nr:peptidase domain-containing ABC transporter [Leptospira ilyithenensis]TGN09717.1 ATP-binding cassette domain-containing protein [Leptospira ilyithenensis]